jgi:hypothetical protein
MINNITTECNAGGMMHVWREKTPSSVGWNVTRSFTRSEKIKWTQLHKPIAPYCSSLCGGLWRYGADSSLLELSVGWATVAWPRRKRTRNNTLSLAGQASMIQYRTIITMYLNCKVSMQIEFAKFTSKYTRAGSRSKSWIQLNLNSPIIVNTFALEVKPRFKYSSIDVLFDLRTIFFNVLLHIRTRTRFTYFVLRTRNRFTYFVLGTQIWCTYLEYLKWSTYIEFEYVKQSTYIEFEYIKWSMYIKFQYVLRVILSFQFCKFFLFFALSKACWGVAVNIFKLYWEKRNRWLQLHFTVRSTSFSKVWFQLTFCFRSLGSFGFFGKGHWPIKPFYM